MHSWWHPLTHSSTSTHAPSTHTHALPHSTHSTYYLYHTPTSTPCTPTQNMHTVVHPPTDKGTFNKTAAFSQYPHDSSFSCPVFSRRRMLLQPIIRSSQWGHLGPGDRPCVRLQLHPRHGVVGAHDIMAVHYLADWSPSVVNAAPIELYDQTHDGNERENDFDALAAANQAYNASMHDVVQHHLAMVTYQFHTLGPTPNPRPEPTKECKQAGGILGPKDSHACCPASCGKCGGKGCADLPGGKTACCSKEVEKKGDSCATNKAPCVV